MELVVSNNSIPSKVKKALLGVIVPLVVLVHALGYDWGATSDEERYARDGGVILAATAAIVLAFALYAHFKKTTVDEPVAVTIAVGGFLVAITDLVLVFDWATEGVTLAVAAVVGALLLPFGISLNRSVVSPVEPQDAFMGERARAQQPPQK